MKKLSNFCLLLREHAGALQVLGHERTACIFLQSADGHVGYSLLQFTLLIKMDIKMKLKREN